MPQVEKIFLERLKRKKAEHATESVSKPNEKNSFGYGKAHGMFLGLDLAEQLFLEVIGEEDDRT